MVTRKQLEPALTRHGFTYCEEPGFLSFQRTTESGLTEYARFFTWSNAKHAAKVGIPRTYLVIDIREGRFRLPLVQWPSETQARTPFKAVLKELEEVFLQPLNYPAEQRSRTFSALDTRYVL